MYRKIRTHIRELTPWDIFLRSALICGLVGIILFGLSLRKIPRLPLSAGALQFNGQSAFNYMRHLSKEFPNRVTWSDSRRKATKWLKDTLKSQGLEPRGMLFSEVIDGVTHTDLENVYAEIRGTRFPNEIIVLAAHYDITDTTVEGAMDDASGVGIVLELARILAKEKTERTILFLLTDSEEFGAFWGAHSFARQFDRADQIVAVANFDFVAPEEQHAILTLCDGLQGGYTPLWLRELALDSLRSVGGSFEVLDFSNLMEFVERAIQIPAADHGTFLAQGIPAFNWVGQNKNFGYQMAHYHHTKHDVAEAMRPESFHDMGRAAERLVRSISELPRLPANYRDDSYWKVSQYRYVDGWVVTVLHILAFIPFLAYSLTKFGRTLGGRLIRNPRVVRVLKNEAKNMGIVLGSLLLGYVVLLLLPALKIITLYEVFPATQKSLLLYSPNFIALLSVAVVVGAVHTVFKRTFAERDDSVGYLQIRHAFHGVFLALIIAVALAKNSYLAVLLLLPPAYLWTALRARRRPEDRVLNTLLLAGGAITFVIMTIVMSTIFHIGPLYWYLFLSAAYGLVSAYAAVLFLMAVTVMIRLFRAFVW